MKKLLLALLVLTASGVAMTVQAHCHSCNRCEYRCDDDGCDWGC
jgi:MinD superfamily P-loop ATPase